MGGRGSGNAGRFGLGPHESGNPNGRPKKGESLRDLIIEYGLKKAEDKENKHKLSNKQFLVKRIWESAIRTVDPAIVKQVLDRHDGSVPTEVKMEPIKTTSDTMDLESMPAELQEQYHAEQLEKLREKKPAKPAKKKKK